MHRRMTKQEVIKSITPGEHCFMSVEEGQFKSTGSSTTNKCRIFRRTSRISTSPTRFVQPHFPALRSAKIQVNCTTKALFIQTAKFAGVDESIIKVHLQGLLSIKIRRKMSQKLKAGPKGRPEHSREMLIRLQQHNQLVVGRLDDFHQVVSLGRIELPGSLNHQHRGKVATNPGPQLLCKIN
jgi:hypothetical protein